MPLDPLLLRALERSVVDDPDNRPLRLHLVDLLLDDGQHAAALGHVEVLARRGDDDPELARRRAAAREGLGLQAPVVLTAPLIEADVPSDAVLTEVVRSAVTLADVAGMEDVKERLRTGFLEPLRNEELRRAFGASLRSSLLLWGPPGCGKTFLGRALAGELGLYFLHVTVADVLDKYYGESEKSIRAVFDEARAMAPAVLFIDELDAIGRKRSSARGAERGVVNQLLTELDGATSDNEGVLVLGATNAPWDVDAALLRPGRFDRTVLVLPPDAAARAAVLGSHLARAPRETLDLDAVAGTTEGWSGADLARLAGRAVELAMHESVLAGTTRPVRQDHLVEARDESAPSTDTWFTLAESFVQFSAEPDRWADLARHLTQRGRRRRR